MVMETPSPQSVGLEFVRQYYTVLNQSPLHLHRFFQSDSSFVHGGLDKPGQESKPVVGQQEIHQRIMQLNFRDCHATIHQVDSHVTLGNGVVVQVNGELSNNGQPMRRFVQTFVLAPQSPNHYYVRNDIFRYQDEIFTDDEETDNHDIDADNELDEQNQNTSNDDIQDAESSPYCEEEIVRNGTSHETESLPSTTIPPPPPTAAVPELSPQSEPEVEARSGWDTSDDSAQEEDKIDDSPKPQDITPTAQSEPKTYANMVSKNASSGGFVGTGTSTVPPPSLSSHPTTIGKPEQLSSLGKSDQTNIIGGNTPSSGPVISGQPPQGHRPVRSVRPSVRSSMRMDGRDSSSGPPTGRLDDSTGDGDRRKPIGANYPDSHQLFVGNLPHRITEDELKQHFMQFGNVVELRINSKINPKPGSGTKNPPNYGFVVFDDLEAAQSVLKQRPITYHNHRLNVEEKKTKLREPHPGGEGRLNIGRGIMGRGGMGVGRGGGGRGSMGGMQGPGRGDNRGGRGGRR